MQCWRALYLDKNRDLCLVNGGVIGSSLAVEVWGSRSLAFGDPPVIDPLLPGRHRLPWGLIRPKGLPWDAAGWRQTLELVINSMKVQGVRSGGLVPKDHLIKPTWKKNNKRMILPFTFLVILTWTFCCNCRLFVIFPTKKLMSNKS